jgi:hypothetical protein
MRRVLPETSPVRRARESLRATPIGWFTLRRRSRATCIDHCASDATALVSHGTCTIGYCVSFGTFLYSRKLLVNGASSSETRTPPDETHERRGYCVGSTRRELIDRITPAAMIDLAAVHSPARIASQSHHHIVVSRVATASSDATRRTAATPRSLLREDGGRHAHDRSHARVPRRNRPVVRAVQATTVKNLRFGSSSVLMLNMAKALDVPVRGSASRDDAASRGAATQARGFTNTCVSGVSR